MEEKKRKECEKCKKPGLKMTIELGQITRKKVLCLACFKKMGLTKVTDFILSGEEEGDE